MKTLQIGLRSQDGKYALAVIKYRYEGKEPEDIAVERVTALVQSWVSVNIVTQSQLFALHWKVKQVICGEKWSEEYDMGWKCPPEVEGFSDDTFVVKIEPLARRPQDDKQVRYTLEDRIRDLANLAERERQALERHAEDIKKRPEFEDEIRQRFFEERLKIDSRPLSD